MKDNAPNAEQSERVSKAGADAVKALEGMPTHAYYSLACAVLHDVAVLIQEKRGDSWIDTVSRIALSVIAIGEQARATREAGL